jgi:biotin operon repressor
LTSTSAEGDRLRGIAAALESLASSVDQERECGEELDALVVQLRAVRRRAFGPARRIGSARGRMKDLLIRRVGEWVSGEELSGAAGISEWARRIRELREGGYSISEHDGSYRLDELPRD